MLFFGTLHSDAYIFLFSFAFCFSFSQLFERPPQTTILLFAFLFLVKLGDYNLGWHHHFENHQICDVNKVAQSSQERCSAYNNLESLSIYDTKQKSPNLSNHATCALFPLSRLIILLSQAVLFRPSGPPALTFFQKWPGVIGIPFPFPLLLLLLSHFSHVRLCATP